MPCQIPGYRGLIRIARFGAPNQYRQSWLRDRIGQKTCFANFSLLFLLSKITFGLVPPPSMVLMSDAKAFTYRYVAQRSDTFNLIVRALAVLLAARFLLLRFAGGFPS